MPPREPSPAVFAGRYTVRGAIGLSFSSSGRLNIMMLPPSDQKKQEPHVVSYGEPPSHARTRLEDRFIILLEFTVILLDLWTRNRMLANLLHIVVAVHLGPFLRRLAFLNCPPPLDNPISEWSCIGTHPCRKTAQPVVYTWSPRARRSMRRSPQIW